VDACRKDVSRRRQGRGVVVGGSTAPVAEHLEGLEGVGSAIVDGFFLGCRNAARRRPNKRFVTD
jgi:hypothetical protein